MKVNIAQVLDLIERAIEGDEPESDEAFRQLWRMLPTIRQLAEQHAAQLREAADLLDDYYSGQSYVPTKVNAAADFLAAPRREPEGE